MNLKKLFGVILLSTILNNAVAKDVDLKILVPFPAGGAQDVVARIVSTGASKLGYTSLVENKPGAGGITGTNECIKRTATEKNLLCMVSQAQALVIPPELEQFVQFKFEDLQFVKLVSRGPIVLITNPKNTKSYNEIINDFKSNTKTNFGSSSWLTTQQNNHFLKNLGNTNSQVVDYKGGNQIVVDIINGTLDYSFIPYSAVMGQYLGGTVRIVGVSPLRAGITALDKIPTIDIKDGWTEHNSADFGLIVGPQARKQDIDNLEKMLNEILTDKSVIDNLQKVGGASDLSSRDNYRKLSTDFRNRLNVLLKK
jgi:tripartite-type tricarboxylate transporter receptor subunit TctC